MKKKQEKKKYDFLKGKSNIWNIEKSLQENYKYMLTKVYKITELEKCIETEEVNKRIKNIDIIIENINNLIEKYDVVQDFLDGKTKQPNIDEYVKDVLEAENNVYTLIEQNNDIYKLKEFIEEFEESRKNEPTFDDTESTEYDNLWENEYSSDKLIISEKEVLLPYTGKDIRKYINNGNYCTPEEVIENVFTIHPKKFELPSVTRLKETYKLMRNKEGASISESLRLAFEVMHEKKLHPAIITACKSQDELDTYLGCLEENKLEYFTSFKVEFKIKLLKHAYSN